MKIKLIKNIRRTGLATISFIFAVVVSSIAQNSDTTDYKKQITLLKKEIEAQKNEFQKLLSSKEVVIVKPEPLINNNNNRYTSVGMNMTTLFSRLVPFGNGIPLAGPTTIMLRKHVRNRAFRLGIGLNTNQETDKANASIRIGLEKKKDINTKFIFTRGFDAIIAAGSFNIPGFRFSNNSSTFLGALISLGLEYNLDTRISVGTETLIIGGLQNENSTFLAFKIVPPLALYLHVNLN